MFTTASQLAQDLRAAQNSLKLHQLIKKLDSFEVLVVDNISYVPLERFETDVLFQLQRAVKLAALLLLVI